VARLSSRRFCRKEFSFHPPPSHSPFPSPFTLPLYTFENNTQMAELEDTNHEWFGDDGPSAGETDWPRPPPAAASWRSGAQRRRRREEETAQPGPGSGPGPGPSPLDWEGDRDRDRHEEGHEEEIWDRYPEEHEEDRAGPTAEETGDWGDWGERVRHFATTDESEGWGAAPVGEATPGVEIRKRPRRQGKGVKARKDSHKLQALVASQSQASGTSKDSL
jgi:hypothetical protein